MRIVKETTPEDVFNELDLKENTTYLIKVKHSSGNIQHKAILFTGFRNGNYCTIYNNTYEGPADMMKAYSIIMVRKLAVLCNSKSKG